METFKTKKIKSTKQGIIVELYENKPFSQRMTKTAVFDRTTINIKGQTFYIKDCKLPLKAAVNLPGITYPAWVACFISKVLNDPPSGYTNEFDVSVKYGEADVTDVKFYAASHGFNFYVSDHVELNRQQSENNVDDPYLLLAGTIIRSALEAIEESLDAYILSPNDKNLKAVKGNVRIATTQFMDNYNLGRPIKNLIAPFLKGKTIQKDEKVYPKYNLKQIAIVTQFC